MPFKLFTSNRLEVLSDKLAEVLRRSPTSAFDREIVVVQSQGMERWLSLQLAEKLGICANVHFPFPNRFMQELAESLFTEEVLDDRSTYEPRYLTWEIMRLLPELLDQPGFENLKTYLSGPVRLLKRLQLSARIADLFDQYLLFRPQMIEDWESGVEGKSPGEKWQADLWRQLIKGKQTLHRAALGKRLIERLGRPDVESGSLPTRVCVFGISALPPFHMRVLAALSQRTEVNLFLMNPCQEYWGEIRSKKEIRRVEQKVASKSKNTMQFDLFNGSVAPELHLEEGNRLLASMGALGRDFFDLILDEFEHESVEDFVEPGTESLVAALQSDILHLIDRRAERRGQKKDDRSLHGKRVIRRDDRSVQIHACHSERREVEVLQDHLLDLFDRNPDLKPGDILVMAPDIETYAPFIQAVFDLPFDDPRRIPFSIADRSFSHENDIVETFLALLDLHNSRLTATEVINILESPVVGRRFDLDESDLELIQHRIRQTRIRWGADAEHKKRLGLPPFPQNTWRVGLERLLLGYALPAFENRLYRDRIVPHNEVEGSEAAILSGLLAFTERLFDTAEALNKPRSLREWSDFLKEILETFFSAENEALPTIYMIRRTLLELAEFQACSGFDEPIDIRTVRHHLTAELHRESYGFGFLTGGVTFCSMLPMRSIPFKIVCLIGMNNDAYPRASRKLGFDLIANRPPERGDRSRRKDDRYLFLETLLSAREVFYISYKGQSIKDNSIIPPSVLVSELLDSIASSFDHEDGDMTEHLVTKHRLQPFSPAYFESSAKESEKLFSYSEDNRSAACCLLEARAEAPPFFSEKLPEPDDAFKTVTLADLNRFLRNPTRFLINRRLEVYLPEDPDAFDDKEAFALRQLDRYQVAQELLACRLQEADTTEVKAAFDAMGLLPHGVIGRNEVEQLDDQVADFIQKTREHISGKRLPPLEISLELEEFTLTGKLLDIYEGGLVFYRYGRVNAKDQLRAWLSHLILNCHEDTHAPKESVLAGLDSLDRGNWRGWKFQPVVDGKSLLLGLLRVYWYGLQKPLHFFPESAFTFAEMLITRKSERRALRSARAKWLGTGRDLERPEISDPYFNLCFRNVPDALDREFRRAVEVIVMPLLKSRQEVK